MTVSESGFDGVRRALLLAGPTASGKSAAALALAQEFGATIVNADSMQVYADLRILTARPTRAEEGQAPHRLFGEIDGAVNFSVGRWAAAGARDPRRNAATARSIFVGGTGPLFPRADRGPVGHAGGSRAGPRPGARRGRGPSDARPARRACERRPGDRRAAQAVGPAAHSARARSVRRDRPAARRLPGRARRACCSRPAGGAAFSSPPTGTRSTAASTPDSTRCSPRARSTRS